MNIFQILTLTARSVQWLLEKSADSRLIYIVRYFKKINRCIYTVDRPLHNDDDDDGEDDESVKNSLRFRVICQNGN